MDLASLFGFIVAWGLILASLAMGAGIIGYWNLPSIVIVFGGCIGSVMMKYPFSQLKGLVRVMKNAFFKKLDSSEEIINTILLLAIEAKKTGILGLERVKVPQPFLQKGIQLAIDGVEPELIASIMRIELATMEERHESGRSMLESFAEYAPAYGMIGTLIGLVDMLTKMDDPKSVGPGMAVAILTTLYGALLANALFLPLAGKLQHYAEVESLQKRLIINGVLSIAQGDHPAVIQERLSSYLDPQRRELFQERQERKRRKA